MTNAQYNSLSDNNIDEKKYSFEFQIFANAAFSNETNQSLKFDYSFKRTLVIYNQQISDNFNICLAGDSYAKDKEKPYQLTPYLKRAYIQYHHQALSVSAGLIVLEHFKYQREIWKLRYVDKTFQNKFNYGENRSTGILLEQKLSSRFSYDIAIISGYNTPIDHSSREFKLMTGQTFNTDFCSFRLFNSIVWNPYYEHVISFFITKEIRKNILGIEVAGEFSNNTQTDEDKYGFSVFGTHSFNNKIMGFARYDMNKNSMNQEDADVLWTGIQYSFKKHLKASLFYKNEELKTSFYGLSVFIH